MDEMLDARRLHYFMQVLESGSVRGAADALGMDPSALSRAISTLERECGVRLFQRHGRGVAATDAGQLLGSPANAEPVEPQDIQPEVIEEPDDESLEARIAVRSLDGGLQVRGILGFRRAEFQQPVVAGGELAGDVILHRAAAIEERGERRFVRRVVQQLIQLVQSLPDLYASIQDLVAERFDVVIPDSDDLVRQILSDLLARDLLDAQADYSQLFDRGRATSLLLFEHVHGESRDRGQAMVDLMAQYEQHGLQLDSRELPDHLPLYLEYLAQLPKEEALGGLQDIAPILALLGARLQQRESAYAVLFDLLLKLANAAVDSEKVAEKIADEARDDTPQALDAVWEEEQVKFFADQNCGESEISAHQRRFAGAVAPQYLNISNGGRQ